jgi:hypothetical protein
VIWTDNILSAWTTSISQSQLNSLIYNPYNQKINGAIVYVGSHTNASLHISWVDPSGTFLNNNTQYAYVPCNLNHGLMECLQDPIVLTSFGTAEVNGGSVPIMLKSGYSSAEIIILTPSTQLNGNMVPVNGVLNATLFLQ